MHGVKIIVGVTGSIAAYKSAVLVRELVRRGAEVKVVMTAAAKQFITPLTMATLSKNPILVEFFNPENGEWNSHVKLGEWADLFLVAPASANTIAKMATGVADNLLLTTFLSARCPVAVAPAMDLDMYAHPATQRNIATLREMGVTVIEPAEGELASGLTGKGRMAAPEEIAELVEELCGRKRSLAGRKFVVTAGATREAIDPVRFITNGSTGKMGYAVAETLSRRGAEVTLVSGPSMLAVPNGVKFVGVTSAEQMYRAVAECWERCDGGVMCAAVADYAPAQASTLKIKKSGADMELHLKRTRDIAAEMGRIKGERILVGFALETDNETANAQAKLKSKNFDFVVLNSLADKGAGFGVDTNRVSFVSNDGVENFPLEEKTKVAMRIADEIEKRLKK